MCGEHQLVGWEILPDTGSSPHVRGAQHGEIHRVQVRGIIPACAGSTCTLEKVTWMAWDHPRMCGEHGLVNKTYFGNMGSSPHVRGARTVPPCSRGVLGIIPACAGSTFRCSFCLSFLWDHPRMCGEHNGYNGFLDLDLGSSPHVRGAHFENSIIPRKRKDNWLFFIQFRFENFLAFRYLLALLHPFLGVPTKDPSFASLGRLINCNPSQSTGDQSAPYTLKAICCSFLAE